MFNDFLDLFIDFFADFFAFISSLSVGGVSYIAVLAAFIIMCSLIDNFVSRG